MTSRLAVLLVLLPFFHHSQNLTGKIVDAITGEPIELAAVYFDNTTIGTTSDDKGEFSIEYDAAVKSTLVISFLGYKKVYISNYRSIETLMIKLEEESDNLDEVNLEFDDILTRQQKLKLFKKEFLGQSEFGRKCKILNENELVLRYSNEYKTLYVLSKTPIIVLNKELGYKVSYELNDFEIQFRYVNPKTNEFNIKLAFYLGTVFFKDLTVEDKKKGISRKRKKAFKGSIQHFMRALYNKSLESENYAIFHKGFKVHAWDFFTVESIENSNQKRVKLKDRVSILYGNKNQSDLYLADDVKDFLVDEYGHYIPILGVYFLGDMSQLRVGDMLPLDYGL